ncbi:MAG: hypothetical protein IT317_03425 [Anaerolineales bacterium]|nr:hypothetical protein [Anaerolineales bacterium]
MLLGVPLWAIGAACWALAVVWALVWPRRAGARGGRLAILRWAHALVWALLGAAAFVGAAGGPAQLVALAALAVYLVFVAALLTTPRAP